MRRNLIWQKYIYAISLTVSSVGLSMPCLGCRKSLTQDGKCDTLTFVANGIELFRPSWVEWCHLPVEKIAHLIVLNGRFHNVFCFTWGVSSVVERFLYTERVKGSIPLSPTKRKIGRVVDGASLEN